MAELPFIASNPAVDEFNRANKVADDAESAQLDQQGKTLLNKAAALKLQTDTTEAPIKLRELTASADLAGTNATTAAAKAPYAGPEAAAQLAQTRASTQAEISGTNNAKIRLHMEAFTQGLELLNRGDVEGAKAAAARVGDTIPDAIIQNSQMRSAVTSVVETAQRLFPNRPKDQAMYIHAHLGELASQAQQNQPINPQTAPYAQAPGAPVPQETTGQQQTWGRVGTDEYGGPTYGWINKGNQTVTPAAPASPSGPAGTPAAPGAPLVPPRPQSALPSAPGQASAEVMPGNPVADAPPMGNLTRGPGDLHGEEYLKTIPPQDAELIRGIAENRVNPNSLSVRGGHRERILAMVTQYKPDYNQTLYTGAQSYQRTTGSAGGRVELATNEVEAALPLALDASRNLPRGSLVPWNTLVQKFDAGTSDPAYYDFISKNMALVNAYMRAMNPQGVPRIAERLELHANNMLNAATSPEAYETQLKALWQEVERSRAAVAKARGGTGPSANEASTDMPMPDTPGTGGHTDNLPRPYSAEEARSLPRGTHFIDPNGVERIVP